MQVYEPLKIIEFYVSLSSKRENDLWNVVQLWRNNVAKHFPDTSPPSKIVTNDLKLSQKYGAYFNIIFDDVSYTFCLTRDRNTGKRDNVQLIAHCSKQFNSVRDIYHYMFIHYVFLSLQQDFNCVATDGFEMYLPDKWSLSDAYDFFDVGIDNANSDKQVVVLLSDSDFIESYFGQML